MLEILLVLLCITSSEFTSLPRISRYKYLLIHTTSVQSSVIITYRTCCGRIMAYRCTSFRESFNAAAQSYLLRASSLLEAYLQPQCKSLNLCYSPLRVVLLLSYLRHCSLSLSYCEDICSCSVKCTEVKSKLEDQTFYGTM